jgi:hypothetical protein
MRSWAMAWVVLSAILIIPDGFSKPTYLLNCRLITTGHPLFRQHCKAESRGSRCGERSCLSSKKTFGLSRERNRANNASVAESSTAQKPTPEIGGGVDGAASQASDPVGSDSVGNPASHESTSGSETQGNNGS